MATDDQKIYLQGLTASGVPYEQATQIVNPNAPIPTAQQVAAGPALFTPQDTRTGDGWITTPPSRTTATEKFQLRDFLRQQPNTSSLGEGADWRVKLQLADNSQRLYKDPEPGVLAPLFKSDGVIFPYTPTIQVNYQADYNMTDLTHSNMKARFYSGSQVSDIQISGTFTAQSTEEADYLMAVIHFFKAASKMSYGQDPDRGTPPPLLFLSGFGENQYQKHPVAIHLFQYTTPTDVDYIRTSGANSNISLAGRRASINGQSSLLGRLFALFGQGVRRGAESPGFQPVSRALENVRNSYVPTKIDLALTLYPMQSRARQTNEFSLKNWGSGELNKRGMW